MTENRAAASRIGYMDGLRAAAMVGVILIHVCAKAATALAADGAASAADAAEIHPRQSNKNRTSGVPDIRDP